MEFLKLLRQKMVEGDPEDIDGWITEIDNFIKQTTDAPLADWIESNQERYTCGDMMNIVIKKLRESPQQMQEKCDCEKCLVKDCDYKGE